MAYKSNATEGIEDYYTENARKNLYETIAYNTTGGITIEGTTLEHHPTLDFFSEDGQLAVLTDRDVVEYKRMYKDNVFVLETKEVSTYKVMFLLEDGFGALDTLSKKTQKHILKKRMLRR